MSRCIFLTALTAAAFLVANVAYAEVVNIAAAKDSTLYGDATRANGAGENIFVGFTNQPYERRSLITFDIASAIPLGSLISAVELRLTVEKANGGNPTIELHRLERDWSEGPSDPSGAEGEGALALTGDSTWLFANNASSAWSTAGGDYQQATTAATTVSNGNPIWSGVNLVADVQQWLDSPALNFGWILLSTTNESGTVRAFASSESLSAAARPVLHVEFAPVPVPIPVPSWALMVLGIFFSYFLKLGDTYVNFDKRSLPR